MRLSGDRFPFALGVLLMIACIACVMMPQAHAQPDPNRTFVSSSGETVTIPEDLHPAGERRFTDGRGNTSIVLPGSDRMGEPQRASAFTVLLPFVQQSSLPTNQEPAIRSVASSFDRPEPQFIIGTDDRTQVADTTIAPYRYTVLLKITLPGNRQGYCTGWLYAPNMVATAGHCLYDGGWALGIAATIAPNGATKPFPDCSVVKMYVPWQYQSNPAQADDFGAVRISCDAGLQPGWFGMEVLSVAELLLVPHVGLTGYPCDKIDAAHPDPTQWVSTGTIWAFGPDLLEYDNDMVGCQSGSPVYDLRTDSLCYTCAVGINEAEVSTPFGGRDNDGVRLTQRVYDLLIGMRDSDPPAATPTARPSATTSARTATPTRSATPTLRPSATRQASTPTATRTPTVRAQTPTATNTGGSQRYYQINGATSVYLEAEGYSQLAGAFRVVSDSSRSAGAYTDTPDKSGNDGTKTYLTYQVDVAQSATFTLWLLSTGPNSSSDSFDVRLDSAAPQTITTGGASSWVWKKASNSFTFSAGQHTLVIQVREDGAAVDKIALMSTTTAPTGLGSAALQPLYR